MKPASCGFQRIWEFALASPSRSPSSPFTRLCVFGTLVADKLQTRVDKRDKRARYLLSPPLTFSHHPKLWTLLSSSFNPPRPSGVRTLLRHPLWLAEFLPRSPLETELSGANGKINPGIKPGSRRACSTSDTRKKKTWKRRGSFFILLFSRPACFKLADPFLRILVQTLTYIFLNFIVS